MSAQMCRVWRNGHLVPPEQPDPIDVFDGDYLKIRIALNLDPPDCQEDSLESRDQMSMLQTSIQKALRTLDAPATNTYQY